MPVVLSEAKIGEVVRPPKTAMYSLNGNLVQWANKYEVTRKDPKNKSVWLNPHPVKVNYCGSDKTKPISANAGAWTITVDSIKMGCIQVDEDAVWLYDKDPKPTDGVRVIRPGETNDTGEPKRRRGGPDTLYEFAFDDEEIKLDDMPAQAQILADIFLEIYTETGNKAWTEKEIDEIVHRPENVEKLHTTQDPMTIFKFYRAPMARKGFLNRKD